LNKEKFGLTLVSVDDRYIYSIGQLSEDNSLRDEDPRFIEIEQFDTRSFNNTQNTWKLIQLNSDLIKAVANLSIIPLNPLKENQHRFLLFGGLTPWKSTVRQSLFLEIDISPSNNSFSRTDLTLSPSSIIQRQVDYYQHCSFLPLTSLPEHSLYGSCCQWHISNI
jgi:hypothetical protein